METELDSRIIEFIHNHHVLTLASCARNQPYCCNCYYAFDENENYFVVKINEGTRHGQEINQNSAIAGTIVLETDEVGKIQGLQFTGKGIYYTGKDLENAKTTYLKKYPFSLAVPGEYLILVPNFYKFTDNRFGIGKKLTWNKINK
ncbi:MAG: pyridoxamine 5'-phosphate oxidase family protein [Bacteroidales bacterium]|jgi:hypothetical protein|nr:pyridoxamine 5'-phosphate oxidase family protein [Bacteroidales bacterium]